VLAGEALDRLFAIRMRAYGLQQAIHRVTARLEAARDRLESAEGSPADTGARALIADIDSALARLRPAPRRGGGGFGGAADRPQPLLARVNGVSSAIGSVHFAPTPSHISTLDEVEDDLEWQTAVADELIRRAESAVRSLDDRAADDDARDARRGA